jgi:hypothetical protein
MMDSLLKFFMLKQHSFDALLCSTLTKAYWGAKHLLLKKGGYEKVLYF